MLLDILKQVSAWVTEHGGSAVLRERLALAQERAVDLIRQTTQLQQENAALRARADELVRELTRYRVAEQFTEGPDGALFKRRADGSYGLGVYCPKCHQATSSFPPGAGQYHCDACNWFSDFEATDLPKVLAQLPK